MEVRLSVSEMRIATQVGIERCFHVIQANRANTHGETNDLFWQRHIEGAMGEMAFAKFSNLYWNGTVGYVHLADVGPYEIRTTTHEDGRLILHHDDRNDARFILAVGVRGKYDLKGWIFGRDGKKDEFVDDPQGGRQAFFVPQNKLKSF